MSRRQEVSPVDAWEQLLRFHRLATRTMNDSLVEAFNHSLDDYDVLHQIQRNDGPLRMGDLAARLLVANSSCNRIVGRLHDAGLVERRPGHDDRREVWVELTAEGRRLHRRMAAAHGKDITALVGTPLLPKALTDLERIVGQLRAAAER